MGTSTIFNSRTITLRTILNLYFLCLFKLFVTAFSDSLYFEVKENSLPQTYVGRIATKPGFTYRFNDEPLEFHLDPETGVIVTSDVPTDRETKSLYNFVILSSSPTYPIQVKIRVIDLNDNVPFWPQHIQTNLTFSESAPIGTKVILDNAIDLDEGDLQYKIDYVSDILTSTTSNLFINNIDDSSNSNYDLPFKLIYNQSTQFLYLEVCSKLDREVQSNYLLNITAFDEDVQSSSAIFNVRILDSNDNPPIFDHSDYVVTLNESIGKDVFVLQVQATDADEENSDNSRVNYYLQNLDDFKIDAKTGVITTVHDGPFTCGINNGGGSKSNGDTGDDYGRICVFTVFAHDFGVPRQDGRTYVTAKIRDTNNHVPIIKFRYFSKSDYAHVDENANNGSVVAAVSVIDFDKGANGQTWLEIIDGNEMNHFRLESIGNSHIIKVNSVLDREKIALYNLTVMAHDRGSPSKSSTDNLIIIVQDHNDHGPKFDKEVYETSVVESQYQTGIFVYSLQATDQDEGINSQIFYSISGPNSHYFKIDSATGLITTEKLIDREMIDSFELRVTARDGGSNPKWAHAILKINVLDINDRVPNIELLPNYYFNDNSSQYEVDIDEGTFLDLSLIIKDNDLGVNGTVDVEILYDYNSLFKIDPESMKLISTQKLDFEQSTSYRIVLFAKDRAPFPHQLTSLTTIVINVNNMDDQLPILFPRKYYSFIPINAVGSFNYSVVINRLQIKDNDFQIPMHFVIHSRDDVVKQLFYINNHGEMRFKNNVNVRLLKNIPKYFYFDIECLGCKPDHNTSHMHIFLLDTDGTTNYDFNKQTYNFSLEENSPNGTIVGQLDVDADQFDLFIIQGDQYEQFTFTKNTLKTTQILDREWKSNYKLQVIAIQHDIFFYIDIYIDIIDVNDCDPYFKLPYDVIAINEDVPLMFTIQYLKAFDADLQQGPDSIQYEIIDNPFGMFSVEQNELKIAKSIKDIVNSYRKSHLYPLIKVIIQAVDKDKLVNYNQFQQKQPNNLSRTLTIFVDVKRVLQEKPRFARKLYELFLSESTPVNERFFKIEAQNLINDSFTYLLNNELSNSFDILPNGQLFVKKPLDREKIDIYLFEIVIENIQLTSKNTSTPLVDSCQMLIHIKDVNDNKPIFDSSSYRFSVPENISSNFFIGQIQATDSDFGPNSQIIYSIVNSYYSSYLEIDPINGYLWTNVNYDREVLPYFEVVVQASDQPIDEDRFTSQTLVRIDILDINDNKPIFEIPSNVTVISKGDDDSIFGEIIVSELVPVNSTLARFKAVDLDSDSQITYTLKDEASIAVINSSSGILSLIKELDREVRDNYDLIIQTSDGYYTNQFHLKIIVEDVNDCRPIWTNFTENELFIPENISIGSEIYHFSAVDYDLGANALFHFVIENYSGNQKYFDILNQKLVVINRLDYEKTKVHNLNISLIETTSQQITSTKLLKINLIDINDCQPMFIRRTETEVVRVLENIDIGSKLLSLQAYDCDVNDVLTYEILSCNTHFHTHRNIYHEKDHELQHKHDSNNCPLKLNIKTGEIVNINNLDREVIESINLKLSVKDSVGHMDKMKVIFIIDDINDESPMFISPNKIIIPNELTKPNTLIGAVKAVDLDLGINSVVTYKLEHSTHSHLFELDRFTGMFRTKITLEVSHIQEPLYLNVSATDGGGLKTFDMIEFIVKPNKPYLKTMDIRMDINENLPIGTEINKLECHDNQMNDGCRFHLVNATDRNFEVDSFTGTITVVDLIDREMLDKRLLEVFVISERNLQIMKVHINVIDQNDNPPYLTNTSIVIHLPETLSIGSQVFDISQLIADEDTNNKFDFQIINCSSSCNGMFSLNRKTGVFTLQSPLDCEKVDKFRILFGVSDGIYLLTSLMDIIVLDENDNKPYFNQTDYIFWIEENTERGTIIGQVHAFDLDISNKNLIYSFLPQNDQDYLQSIFSLDSRNGQFTLSKKLDYEKDPNEYTLFVEVSDGKFKSSPVNVTFRLINLPDNPPVFENSVYKLEVIENKIFNDILCLKAFDADLKDFNDQIDNNNNVQKIRNLTYHLDGNYFKMNENNIHMDPISGCISIVKPLDREKTASINLTASADDGYFNSTAIIYIKILDENDNHPVFDKKTPRTLKIVENVPIDTIVTTFSALDYDEPPNSYIKYELIGIDDNPSKLPFVIGPIDGQFKVTGMIDREQTDHYDIIIRATDYGLKHTDFPCKIEIEDVIDNLPIFPKHSYEIDVFENVSVGQAIFKLDAHDEDPTDEINYKIISGDNFGCFQIEDDSIVIAMGLNYEEIDLYNLKINAIDKAGNIDTTNIRINVLNVLDEKPIFAESVYRLNWFENRLGQVGQFEAQTEDSKLAVNKVKRTHHLRSTLMHAHINYLLLNNFEDSFQLNSSNAVLTIIKPIDRETLVQSNKDKSTVIELKIMAIDSLSRLSNELQIFIKIIDVNDNVPVFLNTDYEFHLKENQLYDLNYTVGRIEAMDPDEDDRLQYSIDSIYEDKFLINSQGELLLRSSLILDREQQSNYEIEVTINDSKHSVRTMVNVIVDDVNDCAPRITKINNILLNRQQINTINSNTFKLKIPLQKLNSILRKNFPLIGLQINDCDEDFNGRVQVRIDDDSLYNIFNVDGQTGLIKSDNRNINLQKEVLLQIPNVDLTIVDLSDSNQLSSEYSIHLDFTDGQSYIEQDLVHKNFVELFISESTPINETLFKFEMIKGPISEMNIYAGDVYNHFTIVNNCLVNLKTLDYESIKSYDLYLQAVNHQKDFEEFQYIFVRVNIVNENDNAPTFLYPVYKASILEEEENIFVTQVWANDVDSPTTKIQYKLLNSNGQNKLPFKIDSNTGHIFTTDKIDRESIDLFKLIVSAEDEDGLFSVATVVVHIEDKNDNPPRFTHLLRANISEMTAVGSFIIQVKSVDKDLGNNSQVTYNLLTEKETFRIDPSNGNIYLIAELDRENKEEYFLTVRANDGSWKSQTTVTLYVLDENDCFPQFEHEQYEFIVSPDDLRVNHSIGRVKAIDQDKALNGLVSYRLKNRSKYFAINSKTGTIYVKQTPKLYAPDQSFLNQHILNVVAADNGLISRSNQVSVFIRCRENVHNFNQTVLVVPEDLKNDTLLYIANAMIQTMNNEENLVKTHYNRLLFSGESIIEKDKIYSILIDNQYETLALNLSVISKNSFAPVFMNVGQNSTIVSEKIQSKNDKLYLINQFHAKDEDESPNNREIRYSYNVSKIHWNKNLDEYLYLNYKDSYPNIFKRKNLSSFEIIDQIEELSHITNPFILNETNGELYLVNYLDYEIITGYSLMIMAKDRAWYSKQTVLPFDVLVEDIEDFIGYNLIDSDKLYHSATPKPDPMSIGVMVVIFFFIILILIISTSFFVYQNQKKRLSPSERKIVTVNSLRAYDCQQYSNELASRLQQEQDLMNGTMNSANQLRLNSTMSSQQGSMTMSYPVIAQQQPIMPNASSSVINQQSISVPGSSVGTTSNINMNPRVSHSRMNSIQKGRLQTPQQQQQYTSNSPSNRMMIKPDIVSAPTGTNQNPSTSASIIEQQRNASVAIEPTVVSSIYTQSNSENYTDNYSNILASAEHYDLENASSIAPSDIDIVYHYKGFRNRDSLHHHAHHHPSKQSSIHAPLSRLSPSVSELSSAHPHILTLQDLTSVQPVPPPPQPPMMNRNGGAGAGAGANGHKQSPQSYNDHETENSYAYSGFGDSNNSDKNMFGRPW